jgi:hypothetical protein
VAAHFVAAEGLMPLAEFVEMETGKGADALDCPQLAAPIVALSDGSGDVAVASASQSTQQGRHVISHTLR